MKKGILLVVMIGLLCTGHVFAANNDSWSVGVQVGYLTGIGISGGYDTFDVEAGVVIWGGVPYLGFGASWFYPYPVSDSVKFGPGVSMTGASDLVGKTILDFTMILGLECSFAKKFAFVAKLGYPGLVVDIYSPNFSVYVEHSAASLLYSLRLGVKYYF